MTNVAPAESVLVEQLHAPRPQAIETVGVEIGVVGLEAARVQLLGRAGVAATELARPPKSWIPRSLPPHVCVEQYAAMAADGFVRMFRGWRASGAESHTNSNAGLTRSRPCGRARVPGDTVAIAQSVD